MNEPILTPPDLFERITRYPRKRWWGVLLLFACAVWWKWDKVEKLPLVQPALTWLRRKPVPQAKSNTFTILVAHLGNDAGEQEERLLFEELGKFQGVEVRHLPRTITPPEDVPFEKGIEAGHSQARDYLKTSHADALFWGTVLKVNGKKALQLSWTASAQGDAGTASGRYQSDADLNLPPILWSDIPPVVGLVVTSRSGLLYQRGSYQVDRLRPFIVGVKQILAKPHPNWSGDNRAELSCELAAALEILGTQAGDNQALKDSAKQLREVLTFWTRDSKPLFWATTQNNLGIALEDLGEREPGTENLRAAGARSTDSRRGSAGLGHDPEQSGHRP